MKLTWKTEIAQWILLLAMFVVAAAAWSTTPTPMPVHWNIAGEADRWGGRFEGILLVPLIALGKLRDAPFWIRLEYRFLDGDTAAARDDDAGITLKGLIEALSRRPKESGLPHAVEAGPFRLRP